MSAEYDKYLEEHIKAVDKAAAWMIEHTSINYDMGNGALVDFLFNLKEHDESKYGSAEYDAYDAHFYGEDDAEEFQLAWLHHIHHNKHHWQHWILVNGYGKFSEPGVVTALEMPKIYVLEMIADWWSFSWRTGNLYEIFDWYEEHKNKIVFHENTRAYVERVLGEIRDALDGA